MDQVDNNNDDPIIDTTANVKAARFSKIIMIISFVIYLSLAIYTLIVVPPATRLPYSGQFGRNGIPMQIALFMALPIFFGLYKSLRHKSMLEATRSVRITVIVVNMIFMTLLLLVQNMFVRALIEVAND